LVTPLTVGGVDIRTKESAMPQYTLLMYQPVDREQDPADFADEHKRWNAFHQELVDAGALVSNKGLAGTDTATTVRVRDGETHITDGPFAETKEYLAGYYLIEVDSLDAALGYAARIPSAEYGSVEVRPGWG
jgi:hypothetical protein